MCRSRRKGSACIAHAKILDGTATAMKSETVAFFCDDFVVFPYLYDVHPGDGGLLVVPGTHKTLFDRPEHLYNNGKIEDADDIPPGVLNITPKAGDFVIISELLTHGALPWKPKDRYRCVLTLRYRPQHRGESRVIGRGEGTAVTGNVGADFSCRPLPHERNCQTGCCYIDINAAKCCESRWYRSPIFDNIRCSSFEL